MDLFFKLLQHSYIYVVLLLRGQDIKMIVYVKTPLDTDNVF